RSRSAALPPAESASADAYAREGLPLFSRVTSPPEQSATKFRSQSFWSTGAQVDDGFAFNILACVIIVIGLWRFPALPEEFNTIEVKVAFGADIFGKGHAFTVFEGSRLSVHFNRERRMIHAFDAEHSDSLKVRSVVTPGFDAPGAQLIGQVSSRQPETLRE